MDGFRTGVDGYYDVADQLSGLLRHRAAQHLATEAERKRSIDSRAGFAARQERVREVFLDAIGGLPPRPDDLAAETGEPLRGDGYAVEPVTFESRPDFHVTANCYVPESDGPRPGVLLFCGHVRAAKADPLNQKACIELARNGFVVLAVDPLAGGERTQYPDADVDDVLLDSGVYGHTLAGEKCSFAGANVARYMVNDARCALDYLAGRPDVDADRVGATGSSGGGVQTTYLGVVDDRVAAAAPCCCLSERGEWLKTGISHDAEHNLYGAIVRELNYDDLVAAMAPHPVCVGAGRSDFFPIEGVYETGERIRRVYDGYDAREHFELVVADTGHASVYELGEGVFEFLCEHLGDGAYEPQGDLAVADESDLLCTPEGSVLAAFPGERTVDDLVREYVAEHYPDAGTEPAVEDRGRYAADLRETVVETFDLDREAPDPHPRFLSRSEWEGLTVERVFFKTERDPDVVVTGVLVSDPDAPAKPADPDSPAGRTPAVVCFENGTRALPERSDDVASLAAEYGTALVFDPRGVGAVRNRELPDTWLASDYHDVYGTEFTLAYWALMLETSLFGMRVYDVLRAVAFLRSHVGGDGESGPVALVGEGVGAYHALYAAAADPGVGPVELRALGPSFHDRATGRDHGVETRLSVFDVIGDCDVPHCLAALANRTVRIERDR